ncbi:MAG TPA: hypothetical protein VLI69_05580 [Gammaproteobacteria bacterium]|nr:hypothetical protein [Gammaproteobacteria bacterium]
MIRKIILMSALAISLNVMAEEDLCVPLDMQSENKEIVLPGPDQTHASQIYFFKNLTEKSIWLDHPVLHPSASAGWSSYLRAGHASAILVNRKNFNLNCAVIKPGKVEYLDCAKAISVCMPKEMTLKSARKGTYWLVEDKSWDDLMKALAKRGLELK